MTDQRHEHIESLLASDGASRRSAAPAGLEDRLFVATQANVSRDLRRVRPIVVLFRIGAPLAAAAVVGVAIWTQNSPSAPLRDATAAGEQDLEIVLASDEWTSDLDDIDAFLDELTELESALALDWSDDLSLLPDEYDYEETTQ